MDKDAKYGVIYDSVFAEHCFSNNFVDYFLNDVNNKTESGRFVLIALYGEDGNNIVPIEDLRISVKNLTDVKKNKIQIMLQKYLYDILFLLERDFTFIKKYKKGNFTYILYQKR